MHTPWYMLSAYGLTVIVGALMVGWIIVKGMRVDHRQKALDEMEWTLIQGKNREGRQR